MKWSLIPKSLAGQLILILVSGVTLALVSSSAIHLYDRNEAIVTMEGLQAAQRIASIVQVMDPLSQPERARITKILETPLQFVRFYNQEKEPTDHIETDARARHLKKLVGPLLAGQHAVRIEVLSEEYPDNRTMHMMMGGMNSMRGNLHQGMQDHHHALFAQGFSYIARIQLRDGKWLEYHNHLPEEAFKWPWHLLWSILILIFTVTALSFLAVRLVTRPLATLASAARSLGHDLRGSPIARSGTQEVKEVISAFNAMQARILQHIQERSSMLAAISHDLHTPLTRMRLRVEMLKDERLRDALLHNLTEMEGMTESTMDYIQGTEGMEEVRQTDIPSLLDGLADSWQELGHDVQVNCDEIGAFPLMGKSFRRALSNLIQNAVKYGQHASMKATMHGERLRISISDKGPGIPEEEMESVLRPFKRLDTSRNSKTGGSGLGLSIADSIIRAHGGDLHMRNRPEGGLEIIVTIEKERFLKRK
ncbi:ATP-binding protein [Magnetococcus sp. PR-3]|uniref:ATP-binding protein n=1 Tax=Magnetococcus sp. PR-3 TaxID=3120355 RepID=UPI002FCE673C